LLLSWFAEEAIKGFPAPSDGVIYAVGDGSHKEKRSKKNPTVQKGKKSKDKPFFWGIKFVWFAAGCIQDSATAIKRDSVLATKANNFSSI
jgi:hypothetical protein